MMVLHVQTSYIQRRICLMHSSAGSPGSCIVGAEGRSDSLIFYTTITDENFGEISALCFAGDALNKLIIGNISGILFVVDMKTHQCIGTMGKSQMHPYIVDIVALPQNRIASSSRQTIKVWSIASCTVQYTLKHHDMVVSALVYDEVNDILISGGHDKRIYVWKYETLIRCIETKSKISSLAILKGDRGILLSGSWKSDPDCDFPHVKGRLRAKRKNVEGGPGDLIEAEKEEENFGVINLWDYLGSGDCLQSIAGESVLAVCPLQHGGFATGSSVSERRI